LRREIEDHRVRGSNGEATSGLSAKLQQLIFDADTVQPVCEIPDSLGVGEVGLPYPSLWLVPAYSPQLTLALHGELSLIIDRLGPDDDSCRRWWWFGSTSSRDQSSHCVDQLVEALPAPG